MEFAAASDQENLVHGFQTAAAAKPLNQGLKGYGAKTPGNKAPKTPFKIPLNDENAPFRAGKSVLKTNGKGNQDFLGGGKGGDLDKNAFITPAGPRTRAPLGMKTTNAKTKAFQTPAALTDSAKTQKKTSPRLRRPKVKVHQAEAAKDEPAEKEREIEYMPPKCIPLPDDPEGWPADMEFPMFKGSNFTRGMESTYFNPVGDDGLTRSEREDLAEKAKSDKRDEEIMQKAMDDDLAAVQASIAEGLLKQKKNPEPAVRKPLASKPPSTVNSRTAAAALSPKPKSHFAAPTAATKARVPSKLNMLSSKKTTPTLNPSAARHAAATTASRSTIGYAHWRSTSTSLRKPLTNITKNVSSTTTKPASTSTFTKPSAHERTVSTPAGSVSRSLSRSSSGTTVTAARFAKENFSYEAEEELMREMQFKNLEEDDEDDVDGWLNSFAPAGGLGEEDKFENFQLTVGEL
ncbi:uncharacterized protein BDZ99DRAFT_443146 [Mytilinidion resinicola]|uniref:Uncharacterized protein n=1 Tax=Mytilinidion resinicola TaxID=574789 RepID=A0A6A6YNU2_9PEZI|nr:uncharacterized protein BDZ99DRAFT_443146 [Mytilinidion resinicola]KAF2810411.1 hypothetical protein BDZ99DRAFT_443146 [Mytilinidion resinicola]